MKGRKQKSDVDRLVGETFTIKVNTLKRSCPVTKGAPTTKKNAIGIVVPNNEKQHDNTKEEQASPSSVPSDAYRDSEKIAN